MMSRLRASACTESAGPGMAGVLSGHCARALQHGDSGDVHAATGLQQVLLRCSLLSVRGLWVTGFIKRVAFFTARVVGPIPVFERAGSSGLVEEVRPRPLSRPWV
jgi:hypothetical protein